MLLSFCALCNTFNLQSSQEPPLAKRIWSFQRNHQRMFFVGCIMGLKFSCDAFGEVAFAIIFLNKDCSQDFRIVSFPLFLLPVSQWNCNTIKTDSWDELEEIIPWTLESVYINLLLYPLLQIGFFSYFFFLKANVNSLQKPIFRSCMLLGLKRLERNHIFLKDSIRMLLSSFLVADYSSC